MGKSLMEVWKDRNQIIAGIKNSILKNKYVEEVASHRNSICEKCENIDKEGSKCFAPGTQPCCGVCGCSLKFLQRSLSSKCEAGKWDAVLTENEADGLDNNLNSEN